MKSACTVAAWLLLIAVNAFAEQNVSNGRDELVQLLKDHQIQRLEILHVSDSLETRTRITPQSLRTLSKQKVIFDAPEQLQAFSSLSTALSEVGTQIANSSKEVRWAILFFDRSGKERYAIFLSLDGRSGVFSDVPLTMQGKLLAWAKSTIQGAFLRGSLKPK